MRRWIVFLFLPLVLGAEAQGYLTFQKEPPPRISEDIRNRWMDGPEALEKEALRNQKIAVFHRFPLGRFLLFLSIGGLAAICIQNREALTKWIRSRAVPKLSPREKAERRLDQIDKVDDISERTRLLDEAIRDHIEERTTIAAKVSTHREILHQLTDAKEQHERLFHNIEAVEFRGYRPTEKDYAAIKAAWQKLLN